MEYKTLNLKWKQKMKKNHASVVINQKDIIFAASNRKNGEVAQLVRAHDS